MTDHAHLRVGIGSRVLFDGEIHMITEWLPTASGTDVVLSCGTSIVRVSVVALLDGTCARLLPTNEAADLEPTR